MNLFTKRFLFKNPQNNLERLRQNLEHLAIKIRRMLESQTIG